VTKPNGKMLTISSIVGGIAAVVATWAALDPWPKLGWITPDQHDADIANISTTLQVFRSEWRCDKYGKELDALYAKEITPRVRDQIADQRRKMDDEQCSRFQTY
jgi:hypothetical protein